MKIIQTFWSGKRDVITESFGWYSPRFHALSWTLSCLQLSKFYDVELYTDSIGYDFLINKLNLPYKKVNIVLDELNIYPTDFWALPKIKTYSLQNEPYLHIDGDVFIWEPFNEKLLSSDFISQNLEITTEYYQTMWAEIYPNLDFIPREMMGYINGINNFACNMGIFGGNDIDFLKKYSNKSMDFAIKNINLSKKINASQFNMFFEQVLFQEMLFEENKTCNFLFDEVCNDDDYKGFGDFYKVPYEKTYLHLLGVYKRNFSVCKMLESYVLSHYPSYFKNITCLFEDYKGLISHKNYNNLFINQDDLIKKLVYNLKEKIFVDFDELEIAIRDINANRLYFPLFNGIKTKTEFKIYIIPCFDIIKESYEEDNLAFFRVKELNSEFNEIPIDEIDEIMFNHFKTNPLYSELISFMLSLLEEDANEMKNEFISMINDRLEYYLRNKLIVIV
jgi:hypothetical protein